MRFKSRPELLSHSRPRTFLVPNEVFLSHSSVDRTFVERLADVLRAHGVPFWYSDANIVGARMWHDAIGAALRRCDWFVLVLSPDAVNSMWVKRELLYSLQQDRFEGRIAPLMHRDSAYDELSWTLEQIQIIDFTQDFDAGFRELLRMWGLGYAPD